MSKNTRDSIPDYTNHACDTCRNAAYDMQHKNLSIYGKPKHRVFCPLAMRQKMVFETEQKALRFIKFNAKNFDSGVVPTRAYYCRGCGGYHLTHREDYIRK